MQCKQCSSIDFYTISPTEYKCKYCGAIQFKNEGMGKTLVPLRKTVQALNTKKGRTILIAVAGTLAILAFIGYLYFARQASPEPGAAENITVKPENLPEFGSENIEEEIPPEGKFIGAAEVPDSIGNVYFIGMYKNTGRSPMRKPMVSVTLYDKTGRKVAAGRGYGLRDILLPGEETPVKILVNRPPAYERYEFEHNPEPPYSFSTYDRPKLALDKVRVAKGQYTGYEVTGEVHNRGDNNARYVEVAAVLYDENGKIIGSGRDYVKADILRAGDYYPFKVGVTSVTGTPKSFKLDYSGSIVK